MWRAPVTLGGGIMTTKGSRSPPCDFTRSGCAVKSPFPSHRA